MSVFYFTVINVFITADFCTLFAQFAGSFSCLFNLDINVDLKAAEAERKFSNFVIVHGNFGTGKVFYSLSDFSTISTEFSELL